MKKIIIHHKYVRGSRDSFDIALLKIKSDFDFSERKRLAPICLPGRLGNIFYNLYCNPAHCKTILIMLSLYIKLVDHRIDQYRPRVF